MPFSPPTTVSSGAGHPLDGAFSYFQPSLGTLRRSRCSRVIVHGGSPPPGMGANRSVDRCRGVAGVCCEFFSLLFPASFPALVTKRGRVSLLCGLLPCRLVVTAVPVVAGQASQPTRLRASAAALPPPGSRCRHPFPYHQYRQFVRPQQSEIAGCLIGRLFLAMVDNTTHHAPLTTYLSPMSRATGQTVPAPRLPDPRIANCTSSLHRPTMASRGPCTLMFVSVCWLLCKTDRSRCSGISYRPGHSVFGTFFEAVGAALFFASTGVPVVRKPEKMERSRRKTSKIVHNSNAVLLEPQHLSIKPTKSDRRYRSITKKQSKTRRK